MNQKPDDQVEALLRKMEAFNQQMAAVQLDIKVVRDDVATMRMELSQLLPLKQVVIDVQKEVNKGGKND